MTLPAASVGAFVKSNESLDRPDLQFHCLAVTGDLSAASRGENAKLTEYSGLTIGGAQLRPESRGFVQCASSNPADDPLIVHNYLSAEMDRHLIIKAMDVSRELAKMPACAILESSLHIGVWRGAITNCIPSTPTTFWIF